MDTPYQVALLFASMEHLSLNKEQYYREQTTHFADTMKTLQDTIFDIDLHPSAAEHNKRICEIFEDLKLEFKTLSSTCENTITDIDIETLDVQWLSFFIVIFSSIFDDTVLSMNNMIAKVVLYDRLVDNCRPRGDTPSDLVSLDNSIHVFIGNIRSLQEMVWEDIDTKCSNLVSTLGSFKKVSGKWKSSFREWISAKKVSSMCETIASII